MKNIFLKFSILTLVVVFAILLVVKNNIYKDKPDSTTNQNTCKERSSHIYKYKENLTDPSYLTTRLVVSCEDGKWGGYMFGPYPAQEHGVFYFSEQLENLIISQNNISFDISRRDLFNEPFTLQNYKTGATTKGSSFSRVPINFNGQIMGNKMKLTCLSEPLECYSQNMMFDEK